MNNKRKMKKKKRIGFSISAKNAYGILIGIALNL
jgi:hypothetical protein